VCSNKHLGIKVSFFQLGQRDALAEILGSIDLADDYIDVDKGEVYMARGHLAPRADFIYKSWQVSISSTFYEQLLLQ